MPDDIVPLSAKERAALAVLCEAATPGPWQGDCYNTVLAPPGDDGADWVAWIADVPNRHEYQGDKLHTPQGRANALLIAACREAVPRLLATCDALERERDDWRAAANRNAVAMNEERDRLIARCSHGEQDAERAETVLREMARHRREQLVDTDGSLNTESALLDKCAVMAQAALDAAAKEAPGG